MEEDAGKSLHDIDPYDTLIDLNRATVEKGYKSEYGINKANTYKINEIIDDFDELTENDILTALKYSELV
jgi:hypothetical protein